jgi:hypothetical protein
MFVKSFAFACAAVVLAMPAAAAVSVPSTPKTFDSLGDLATLTFGAGYANDNPQAGLTAAAVFRLSALGGASGGGWKDWTFTIDNLANTSDGPVQRARLSAFGFDVSPDVKSVSASGMFDLKDLDKSISNGIKVEVCFRDAGGSCSGGGNGGLWGGSLVDNEAIPNGDNPINTFTLKFATAQTSITLDKFVVRYQAIDTVAGIKGGSGVGTVLAVPEPASWAMLIAGFGLVGAAARRRRTVVAA